MKRMTFDRTPLQHQVHRTVHLQVSSAAGDFGDKCGTNFESNSKLSGSFPEIDLPALDTPVGPGSFDPFVSPNIADGDPSNEIDLVTGVEDYRYEFTPWNNPETFPP
jgi:hypothetical protein